MAYFVRSSWICSSQATRAVVEVAAQLQRLREAQNQIISVIPVVPVLGDTLTPRPSYLLVRGQYDDHGDEVQPSGLSQIFPYDESLPSVPYQWFAT